MSHASTAAVVFVDAGFGPGALSTPIAVHAVAACSGPPDEGLQQAYQQMSATFTTDELLEQAMQQIAKLRGELHCLRAQRANDLFRTGNSNGGTANDNQQAAQHQSLSQHWHRCVRSIWRPWPMRRPHHQASANRNKSL